MNGGLLGRKEGKTRGMVQSTTLPTLNPELYSKEAHEHRVRELALIKERLSKWSRNKENNRLFQSETLILTETKNTASQLFLTKGQPEKIATLRIQDFEFGELVGRGASAAVHLAVHKATGALLCIKALQRSRVEAQLDKFIQGLKIQMCIDHPNVAKVYGLCLDHKHVYIVMQYCVDGDLRSNLYEIRNSADQAREVLRGIAKGLKHLHESHVHHRDLKLENVLMGFGVPKISDFELSLFSKVSFLPRKTICGSPAYFSPQMIRSQKYNKKADIWCLGIVFYEVICGYFPFSLCSLGDLDSIAKAQIKDPPRGASEQGMELVRRMLEKEWVKRATLEEVLAHRFLRVG